MSLAKKLLIKNGYSVGVLNAPTNFSLTGAELPPGVTVSDDSEGRYDCVLLFVRSQDELKHFGPTVVRNLKEDGFFWIAYPKKSSKIKTDIHRDAGWEPLNQVGFYGVSLISIDDTWSAMRHRHERFIKALQPK